jgi:hypothetical protein
MEHMDELADAVAEKVAARLSEERDTRPLLNLTQVGERLGISPRAAKELVNSAHGKPPRLASVLIGKGARRVEQAEVDRYLAERRGA